LDNQPGCFTSSTSSEQQKWKLRNTLAARKQG
jgi:hypothetical protein